MTATLDVTNAAASGEYTNATITGESSAASSTCCNNGDGGDHEGEALVEVDTILTQERWRWVQELVEGPINTKTRLDVKMFFLKLVKANTVDAMDIVLSDLESWRLELGSKHQQQVPREVEEVARTLFLLGADKQLDLQRTATETHQHDQHLHA
uniref:Uncharacterized protein n=1 Tax=Globisporangium ultimum (strain ATCC 200006 / CBS 805.95 / DAOM BR144) TaxID=431595 RepID=K3WXJ6_GLOUD